MRSIESSDYQDVPRPVAAMAVEYRSGSRDSRHKHRRAQLLYSTTGVLTVVTNEETWTVPPQRAVWLPGGVEHEVIFRGDVSFRTLYVEPVAVSKPLPSRCKVIEVSDLLRSLILEAMLVPTEYELGGRDERLMLLILDEIVRLPTAPLHMRMPSDERLLRVCRALVAAPDDARDLDEWASVANMSRRTFTRTFRSETGSSFSDWRQQARIFEALALLATGKSVTTTALEVGYGSVSAFTAMFRRSFGVAPTAYLNERMDQGGFIGFFALRGVDFGSGSRAFEIAPSVSWPALRLGSARARLRGSQALSDGSLARYEQSLLQAQEDVEHAVTQLTLQQSRLASLLQSASHGAAALDIAMKRYRAGSGSYMAVLENQRALFDIQQELAQAETASYIHVIALYKALGWGTGSRAATPVIALRSGRESTTARVPDLSE